MNRFGNLIDILIIIFGLGVLIPASIILWLVVIGI